MGTLVSSTNNTDCHDITENIVESGVKHLNPPKPCFKGMTVWGINFFFYSLDIWMKTAHRGQRVSFNT
jgi:hypothetical protein